MSNQSIVSLEGIRGGSDLFCLTNSDRGSDRVGSWHFPDGREVPQSGNEGFVHNRGGSFIALTSSGSATPPSGLYRCVIPDSNNQEETLFAAIYRNGEGTKLFLRTFTVDTLRIVCLQVCLLSPHLYSMILQGGL